MAPRIGYSDIALALIQGRYTADINVARTAGDFSKELKSQRDKYKKKKRLQKEARVDILQQMNLNENDNYEPCQFVERFSMTFQEYQITLYKGEDVDPWRFLNGGAPRAMVIVQRSDGTFADTTSLIRQRSETTNVKAEPPEDYGPITPPPRPPTILPQPKNTICDKQIESVVKAEPLDESDAAETLPTSSGMQMRDPKRDRDNASIVLTVVSRENDEPELENDVANVAPQEIAADVVKREPAEYVDSPRTVAEIMRLRQLNSKLRRENHKMSKDTCELLQVVRERGKYLELARLERDALRGKKNVKEEMNTTSPMETDESHHRNIHPEMRLEKRFDLPSSTNDVPRMDDPGTVRILSDVVKNLDARTANLENNMSGFASALSQIGQTLVELVRRLPSNCTVQDSSTQTNEIRFASLTTQTNTSTFAEAGAQTNPMTSSETATQTGSMPMSCEVAIQTCAITSPEEERENEGSLSRKRKLVEEETITSNKRQMVSREQYEWAYNLLRQFPNAPARELFRRGERGKRNAHCAFCKRIKEHDSDACPNVTEALERRKLVACLRCLCPSGHTTRYCLKTGQTCYYCGGVDAHHSAVCLLPEDMQKAKAVVDAYKRGALMP